MPHIASLSDVRSLAVSVNCTCTRYIVLLVLSHYPHALRRLAVQQSSEVTMEGYQKHLYKYLNRQSDTSYFCSHQRYWESASLNSPKQDVSSPELC